MPDILYGRGTTPYDNPTFVDPSTASFLHRQLSFRLHLLQMFHHIMALMTLVLGCLANILVMPVKDLVGKVNMMMMISSRSSR